MARKKVTNDCLRQCVARIVGRPPSRVPNFVGKWKGKWQYGLCRWLRRIGWLCVIGYTSKRRYLSVCPGVKSWIEIGRGRYSSARDHHAVVVGDNGTNCSVVTYDGGNPLRSSSRFIVLWKAA